MATLGGTRSDSRREQLAIAFFGTWAIVGLFVDGWSHQANKPETFFTPWHLMLYSGFVGAVIWFAVEGWRTGRSKQSATRVAPSDRLTTIGLVLFAIGGVGDGVWHEVFGIEVDLEALLSPTHLLLMTGGLIMLSTPIRWAIGSPEAVPSAPTMRQFLPVLVGLTLCSALATFFTMYLGAQWPAASLNRDDMEQSVGVASVLARNLLVLAPLLFAMTRWRLPLGSFTVLMTANAVLMAALEGFDFVALAIPFVVAGVVGDVLASRVAMRWVSVAVPLVLWSVYFLVHEIVWGIDWTVELWTGAIFLACASSYGLGALLRHAGVND